VVGYLENFSAAGSNYPDQTLTYRLIAEPQHAGFSNLIYGRIRSYYLQCGVGPMPAISAPRSGGRTVKVGGAGVVTLPGAIQCTGPGQNCPVKTVTSTGSKLSFGATSAKKSKKKTLKLGSYRYTVKAGKKGKIKAKLSKKAFRLLKRLHKVKTKVALTVRRGDGVVKRTLKVTFEAKTN
jgi:hypothetical protein